MMAINQLCGCFAMINYAAVIFEESGSNLSPNVSAIVVGLIQIVGAYFSTVLVDRSGRKILLSGSLFGTALGLFSFAIYSHLKESEYDVSGFSWIPLASFSFTIFIANWGILTLPFLVLAEIVPIKVSLNLKDVTISNF